MSEDALISVNNLQHKVVAPVARDPNTSLMALAERYFRTQVAGQAEGTVDAKQRDLTCFLNFYGKLYGHDDRREWFKSVAAPDTMWSSPASAGPIPAIACYSHGPPRKDVCW